MVTHINLSSFAGGGKTTIAKLLIQRYRVVVIPQITTRPPRPVGEGPEYVFESEERFSQLERDGNFLVSKSLLAGEEIHHHGVLREEFWPPVSNETELVLSMFGSQAPTIKAHIPRIKLIFIGFRDMEVLRKRLWHRCQVDGSNFDAKWELNKSYIERHIECNYDHVVYNDTTPEECLNQIIPLIKRR